jgi:hypothetical protein
MTKRQTKFLVSAEDSQPNITASENIRLYSVTFKSLPTTGTSWIATDPRKSFCIVTSIALEASHKSFIVSRICSVKEETDRRWKDHSGAAA